MVLASASTALLLVQCSSFEEDPGTTTGADATTGSEASDDGAVGPVDDAGKDPTQNCLGTLDDDFERTDLTGGKWDTAFENVGDGGMVVIFGPDGGRVLGVKTGAGGEQLGGLGKILPPETKSLDIEYEQSFGPQPTDGGDAGAWFATLVTLLVDTPAGRYTLGTTGQGTGAIYENHAIFALEQDGGGPTNAKGTPKLGGSATAMRLKIAIGPKGTVEVRTGKDSSVQLAAAIDSPITGISLLVGIGAVGDAPSLQTAYGKVHACWR